MKALKSNIPEDNHSLNNTAEISKADIYKIVSKLFHEFPQVFNNKLGEFKGAPVQLKLKTNAVPKFHKPLSIPFSLKEQRKKKLNDYEKENILSQ